MRTVSPLKGFLLALVCLCASLPVLMLADNATPPAPASQVLIPPGYYQINLTGHLEYYQDDSDQLTLEDARALPDSQWSSLRKDIVDWGFTRASFWYRISLHNLGNKATDHILVIPFPLFDTIEY